MAGVGRLMAVQIAPLPGASLPAQTPLPGAPPLADLRPVELSPASVEPPPAELPSVPARPAVRPVERRAGLGLIQSVPSAIEALRANTGRAILTTLGIVIGVAAVIAIVALGQGSTASVTSQISNLGTNVITVMAGSTSTSGVQGGAGTMTSLKLGDADAIAQQVTGIERVSPVVSGSAQLVVGSQNWQTRITGVRPEYQQIQNWTVAEGGFFDAEDETSARNVAVIGQTVATNLFPSGVSPVGQSVRIRNVPFTIVGVLASKGSGFGGDQDDTVLIPFQTAQIRLFGATNLSSIVIQATLAEDMTKITTDVTALLRERHRLQASQTNDFVLRNNNELLTTVQGISNTLTMLLGGVAAVSLVVGGIGIMNIMLVSVTERTREIGIRMAIGARPSDILTQFLIEAIVLACVGGIIGILVGLTLAYGVRVLLGYATSVPLYSVLLSFGFAAAVGVFFGIYPARKASRLDPIEALRYQ